MKLFNVKLFLKVTFTVYFIFIFSSCECFPVTKGVIVDELTHMPIRNAQIQFGGSKTLSNEVGQFEISSGGCNIKLTIAKYRYKSFVEKITSQNGKINIELDDEIIEKDLDKPKYLNSDSSSYLVVQAYRNNSTHFEYFGTNDSIKVYLTKFKE